MNKNIFERNSVATGDAFIGRTEIVDEIYRELSGDREAHLSYNGLRRSGKSSIRQRVEDMLIADNVDGRIIISLSMDTYSTVFAFWDDVVACIDDYAQEHELRRVPTIINAWRAVFDRKDIDSLNPTITRLFAALNGLGIRVILMLDEFDKAQTLFKEFDAQFELLRTLNTESGRYRVSTLLIHRRLLETISKNVHNSSTFYEAFTKRHLGTFNDDDMAEYYDVFKREFGYELSDAQRDMLAYYAGNVPYLLSNFGWYISEQLIAGDNNIDITGIYEQHLREMTVHYYKNVLKLLEEDGLMTTAVKAVVGPQPDPKRDGDELKLLTELCYIKPNAYGHYDTISEKFYEVLSLQEVEDGAWSSLRQFEVELKRLVDACMARMFPGSRRTYDDEMWAYINRRDQSLTKKYEHYRSTACELSGINSIELLRLLTLTDLTRLVLDYYNVFADTFADIDKAELDRRMSLCSKARNMRAHNNEDLLSDEYVRQVRVYCADFIDHISQKLA